MADALDDTPRTAADLAAALGIHADALGRAMRLLAAHGVFERHGDRFRHSPASRLLRTDHVPSLRALVRMLGNSPNWRTFEALEHSVRTGAPAAERVLPGGYWAHYATHPEDSAVFNEAMAGKAYGQVARIVASYDFSPFGVIGDIGGGRGHLLHAVLELDILMLALLGGSQRTRREYEALLGPAGFAVEREIDTGADISILEARAV